jgi:hypothetical protein
MIIPEVLLWQPAMLNLRVPGFCPRVSVPGPFFASHLSSATFAPVAKSAVVVIV